MVWERRVGRSNQAIQTNKPHFHSSCSLSSPLWINKIKYTQCHANYEKGSSHTVKSKVCSESITLRMATSIRSIDFPCRDSQSDGLSFVPNLCHHLPDAKYNNQDCTSQRRDRGYKYQPGLKRIIGNAITACTVKRSTCYVASRRCAAGQGRPCNSQG